ncbi:hypothetical protein ONZ45_g14844 [Pleurotus djamor]|nr:hypothetical protein ONZ45_g14844 [Pleurotus djamor]
MSSLPSGEDYRVLSVVTTSDRAGIATTTTVDVNTSILDNILDITFPPQYRVSYELTQVYVVQKTKVNCRVGANIAGGTSAQDLPPSIELVWVVTPGPSVDLMQPCTAQLEMRTPHHMRITLVKKNRSLKQGIYVVI